MGDQLVTPEELASFLQADDLDLSTATLLIEMATGKIQAAAGQYLIELTDTALLSVDIRDGSPWLALPQLPVRSVDSVVVDGSPVTDFVLSMQQLWRSRAWNMRTDRPTEVAVTYTHGYSAGTRGLQLARDMCLALAGAGYDNPGGGVTDEKIDDYQISYADADSRMQVTPGMRDMLKAQYGIPAFIMTSRG